MQDDDAAKPDSRDADDAQSEALSRAAREAVRQPADPRLEKSFAKLGLFSDEEAPRPPRPGEPINPPTPDRSPAPAPGPAAPTPPSRVAAPAPDGDRGFASPPVDLDPLRAQIGTLEAAVERLERRASIATSLLVAVLAAVLILLVVVLARG